MTEPLDAHTNQPWQGGPSFSLSNRLERMAFRMVWRLFARIVPPPFNWAWRRLLLRMFGARIGPGARVYPTAKVWLPRHLTMGRWSALGPAVDCYNQASIVLGEQAIVSQRAFLCAGGHDYQDATFQLVAKPISVGTRAWVAAEAYVGPGVAIGDDAVVGARACVTKDVPSNSIWAGNPARQVVQRGKLGQGNK